MRGTMVYVEREAGKQPVKGTITVAAMTASGQSHLYIVELDRQADWNKQKKDRVAVEISVAAEKAVANTPKVNGEAYKVPVRLAYEGVDAERVERQLRDIGVSDWTIIDSVHTCRIDVRTLNGMSGSTLVLVIG